MKKEDCYFLGKITRKHGLQGNVILKLDTDQPEMYHKMNSVFLEINGLLVPFFIEKQQWQKSDTKIISFKNSSEAMVEQSVGKDVYLPLSTLPPLSGNKFYYHEVIGFQIKDENDKLCGTIVSINDQTAQNYFILKLNEKDIIIPIIRDWILEVSREKKFIKMELPDGLMDVFLTDSKNDEH
ncbi:MAG: ribosome maturation factor RimM [Bergeyella sp.]